MKFNEKLKHLRLSNGFTQIAIAKKLGITDRAYQRYEYGEREPNFDILLKLSIIFNVSLDDLLCREDYLKEHEAVVDEF